MMADRPISDLTQATQIKNDDLFLLQQDNGAKSLRGQVLTNYINESAGITNIQEVSSSSEGLTIRITYNNGHTFDYTVPFASSAVESVNGKSGVVVLTGSDINTSSSDTTKIGTKVGELNSAVGVMSNTVDEMSSTVSGLNSAVGTISDSVDTLSGQITSVSDAVNQFNAQLAKTEVLIVSGTISSLPVTFSNSAIETDMVCIHSELSNPLAQVNDWTVNTDTTGQVTISGTISGSTNITLYLMKSR